MSTTKTRISITAGSELEEVLRKAAKRENVPVAAKAAELLRLALEIEEDLILAEIADERLKKSHKFVSHEKTWNKF